MGWVAPVVTGALGAIGSAASGYFNKPGNQETKLQKQRRKLIDELLASLKSGQGPLSDLFSFDEDVFNKSYVEPALSRFNNRIAPQIQQNLVYSGLQRGTGLQDELSRAGVDLEQMLNEQYAQLYEGNLNRKLGLLQSILGGEKGAAPSMSGGQAALGGLSGYLGSEGFSDVLEGLGNWAGEKWGSNSNTRKGYENTTGGM